MSGFRSGILAAGMLVLCLSPAVLAQGSDLSNWIKPVGFVAPNLRAGQYAFQVGFGIRGYESRYRQIAQDGTSYADRKNTADIWSLRSQLTWAVTDHWIIENSSTFSPAQKTDDAASFYVSTIYDQISRQRFDSDHDFSTSMTIAYKPRQLFEIFLTGHVAQALTASETVALPEGLRENYGDNRNKSYELFVGFNVAR